VPRWSNIQLTRQPKKLTRLHRNYTCGVIGGWIALHSCKNILADKFVAFMKKNPGLKTTNAAMVVYMLTCTGTGNYSSWYRDRK
jgi:hypothetical protein